MRNGTNPTTMKLEDIGRIEAFKSDIKRIKIMAAQKENSIAQEIHLLLKGKK